MIYYLMNLLQQLIFCKIYLHIAISNRLILGFAETRLIVPWHYCLVTAMRHHGDHPSQHSISQGTTWSVNVLFDRRDYKRDPIERTYQSACAHAFVSLMQPWKMHFCYSSVPIRTSVPSESQNSCRGFGLRASLWCKVIISQSTNTTDQ